MSRVPGIPEDEAEFKAIAKGLIRKDLARYILKARFFTGSNGKAMVAIPITEIDIPTLRYGYPDDFVIGQGEGDVGDDLGPVEPSEEEGDKSAGEGGGSKIILEMDEEEYLDWFGELLKLPRIKPKGDRTIYEEREKYNSIHRLGPKSALQRIRTFKEALKRSVATGQYVPPEKSEIIIIPPDMRFLTSQKIMEPKNNAVLGFMRDISGSMGPEEAEALSKLCDYCERWLRASYTKGAFDTFYVVHDGEALEVQRNQFLATESLGGTIVSTAHDLASKIIDDRYPPSRWNIYLFYFSDGFNYDKDNDVYLDLMQNKILPVVNQYSYGQTNIQRPWWDAYSGSGADTFSDPGTIGHLLQYNFGDQENVATAEITGSDQDSIIEAIKAFFEKGN